MSSNEEDEESERNPQMSFLYSLQRDQDYINSLYILKKSINIEKNVDKIFGSTREKNFSVIITKISNISLRYNSIEYQRLKSTTELIEENIILVENLWLEEIEDNSGIYNLYLSEFTKSIYRNEYNLISLNHYFNENHSEKSYKLNIIILLQLLHKLNSIHTNNNFSHLNLTPNNIYFNIQDENIYLGPPKIFESPYDPSPHIILWYTPPEDCYIEKNIKQDLASGIKYDIWSVGCILCEMFFLVTPLFQTFSKREKMKKIIEVLGVPKTEDIDYMSNQEYSFIQSTEESIKNYNKLKEILLIDKNEINFTSINSNIKKIILEIITKCLCYNRHKRISLNEIINQIDYIYDRYIKEKPMKIDTMNIINRDNLMQLNAPIINISLNPYKSNKNTLNSNNSINDSNNIDISNEENNDINIDNNNNDNIILSTSNQQKNYDSFISDRYSSASMMWNNNNMNNRNINNNFNFNKNFSKFGSLSSISSNKNYNKQQYFTSMTNNNNFNNNATNISERFSDGNSQIKNQYEQTVYTNTEINRKIKESTDGEYAKLQNRKYIFLIFYFLLFRIG